MWSYPADITVPVPTTERPDGSRFLSFNTVDLDADTWPDIALLHTNISAAGMGARPAPSGGWLEHIIYHERSVRL